MTANESPSREEMEGPSPGEIEDEHYGYIQELNEKLTGNLREALHGVAQARMRINDLLQAYDIEYAEGTEGSDMQHALEQAAYHLRHAQRIAQHRISLFS